MRRLIATDPDQERGAVAVMFALLLVVLVGFIALAVDMGATYAKRQELQNGADAAALAAAQECATAGCSKAGSEAEKYAPANVLSGVVDEVDVSYPADNVVRVDVSGTQEYMFLPVMPGAPKSGTIDVSALAVWGTPTSGTLSLPVIFSMCDFDAMGGASGVPTTIFLTKADMGCDWGPDGNAMPGGFGIIGDGSCDVYVNVDDPWVPVDTGNNLGCGNLSEYLEKVILVPIFDECRMGKKNDPYCPQGEGLGPSEREYRIYSFAAMRLHEYSFPGLTTTKNCGDSSVSGNESCIRGTFVEWVELEDAWDYEIENPDLGASVVSLIDARDLP